MTTSKLTLSERQLKALYGTVRSDNLTRARMGIPTSRNVQRREGGKDYPTTDESHLTPSEMRDLELRLAEFLFPRELPDLAFEVAVQ